MDHLWTSLALVVDSEPEFGNVLNRERALIKKKEHGARDAKRKLYTHNDVSNLRSEQAILLSTPVGERDCHDGHRRGPQEPE